VSRARRPSRDKLADVERIANFIDGEFRAPVSGQYLDNVDPATGQVYSQLPDSDSADLDEAVAAAERAFPSWSRTTVEKRSEILLEIADRIDQRLDELARAESIDGGKSITLARTLDIPRASSNFRFFAHAITQFSTEAHPMGGDALNYTLRDPLGVVGCIAPWNLPLYLLSWKVAPAIAAGNCVIAKPSEMTPMTSFLLGRIVSEAGLPPGVLNIVHGVGAKIGAAITAHPRIKAISFTGGTKTGAEIARVAAPKFKKLSLELGGKNPTVIFADCVWEDMITTVVRSAFSNQGEICLCGSRILIERSIYERFREEFVSRTSLLRLGDPLDAATEQGAVISRQHMEKVLSYIELATQEGGRILTGGRRATVNGRCRDGFFIEPTVIEGLSSECRTNQEEIFGPVATLIPFDSEDDAISQANSTEYGLSASLWSSDLSRCHRLAQRLEAGIVWVNTWLLRDLRTPFGGVKNSGVGREGGFEALRFFTEPKNVCIKL
jgi:aminomuconate-semialdehyde/2-hydroxymuconate-6-semialdehyde dehydrogenase